MKVPYSWLKEFVDVEYTPQELGDKLVGVGFEIEEYVYQRDSIKNVVCCKVLSQEKHPDSDHLNVCVVTDGKDKYVIVTGAQNVTVGDIVPVALDGAVLPDGKTIRSGSLRGIVSEGMMCSGGELGLTEDDYPGAGVHGILILSADVKVGSDINDVIGNDDVILDVAVTANRPDCNSILGVAREVAAICGKKIRLPNLSYKVTDKKVEEFVSVQDESFDLCPRYMAAAVYDVKQVVSPKIIRDRLKAVGIRPINNLVDVTNYVLTEIGQPMHAFDRNNLSGKKIIVRTARPGEKILALDGKEYELCDHHLVICDAEKPVAVAGVMGGEKSSILPTTETVILESARFARDSVRHTSRELNLHSDSSARFEKGIDFYSQEIGLHRALALFDEYGWGKIAAGEIDLIEKKSEPKSLVYDYTAVNSVIGIDIAKEKIVSILNALDLDTTVDGNMLTTVLPPWREDLDGVNDVAEEVVRFYGYDELKPRLISTKRGGKSDKQLHSGKIKALMVSYGCQETVTYSFISPKAFDLIRLPQEDVLRQAVEISNPLGADFSVMRTTLAPSMLKLVASNYVRGNKEARLFEVANVYLPKSLPLTELPDEASHLSIVTYGEEEDFYKIKAILEDLSDVFALHFTFDRANEPFLHPGRSAYVYADGNKIGYVGEVHPLVLRDLGVDRRVYIAELDERYLAEHGVGIKPYKAISKYQAVERDLALIAPIDLPAADILSTIESAAGDVLESVEIFDVYVGGQVPKGKKSVAVTLTMRLLNKTLTDVEVNAAIADVLGALNGIDVSLR
ncbi:MAG: phenylalanine--tRNA ligase subunit beta [Clostridia bacterium]|nr:phenylalanine--tRNA ligase subunit beta [Clostridia bacterium]